MGSKVLTVTPKLQAAAARRAASSDRPPVEQETADAFRQLPPARRAAILRELLREVIETKTGELNRHD